LIYLAAEAAGSMRPYYHRSECFWSWQFGHRAP